MRFFLLLSVSALFAPTAFAVPTLIVDQIGTGGVDAVVTDGDLVGPYIDNAPSSDVVFLDASVATWDIRATADASQSTPAGPNSNLLSFTARNIGPNTRTLVVAMIEDYGPAQFTPGFQQVNFRVNASDIDEVGGNVSVDFYGQVGTNPTAPTEGGAGVPSTYGLQTIANSVFSALDLQEGEDAFGTFSPLSPYSTALFAVITADAGTAVSFDFSVEAVPEPGFYGLLSIALSGLFFFGYRKRNAAATGELNG